MGMPKHINKRGGRMKYKIIIDCGIPYTEEVNTEEELKRILKGLKEKAENEPHLDIIILDEKDEDISETQFIEEMIMELD
jgi:hypothetical protein